MVLPSFHQPRLKIERSQSTPSQQLQLYRQLVSSTHQQHSNEQLSPNLVGRKVSDNDYLLRGGGIDDSKANAYLFNETLPVNNESYMIDTPPTKQGTFRLTERDVHKYFEASAPLPRVERTKQTVNILHKNYVSNTKWWKNLFFRSLPVIETVKAYKKRYLFPDLAAGVATGIAAIPIGMSYAMIARFPPAYGLYNNLFYPILYMLLGTGKQVCVGTSAIEAMMGAESLAQVLGWEASDEVWLNGALGLSLFVGINLLIMRCLGLGLIANFLADPVVSGFSTGCAVTIATSQLQYLFGIDVPRSSTANTWLHLCSHIHQIHWGCFLIGVSGILLLALFNHINQKWFSLFPLPGSLFVMIIFIFLGYLLGIDESPYNIKVIGDVPKGLPMPKIFDFDSTLILPIFKASVLYSLVYFFIHMSIARSVAQKKKFTIDNNQELLALGASQILGSFLQCYPIATSVARTSIACIAGAITPLYTIISCLTIALTITVLTPLLYYLPKPALASVVLFGVYFMMYFAEALRLLKLCSPDFVLWIVCFISTVFFGAMQGIIMSVCLSLLWIIKDNAFPATGILGRLPGTTLYRSVKAFTEAEEIPGAKILQFDAALNFSNSSYFENKIIELSQLDEASLQNRKSLGLRHFSSDSIRPTLESSELDLKEDGDDDDDEVKVIIIDASSITRVDITAIRMLENLACRLEEYDKLMLFANWKGPMRSFLEKAKFYETVPLEHCFANVHDAVKWAEKNFLKKTDSINKSPHTTEISGSHRVAAGLEDHRESIPIVRRQRHKKDPLHTLQL